MSGSGNCYDNAVMESFFHTLKTEWVSWHRYRTRAEATSSIFDYIETFYNRERRYSTLDYLSPVQYENIYAKLAA
jgi:transposase InsO family protein